MRGFFISIAERQEKAMTLEQQIQTLEEEVEALKRQLAELKKCTSRHIDALRSDIHAIKSRAAD